MAAKKKKTTKKTRSNKKAKKKPGAKRKAKTSKNSTPTKRKTTSKKSKSAKKKKASTKKKLKKNILHASSYKGSNIEVAAKNIGSEVKVDGKVIVTTRDADTGAYSCPETPYVYYDSLEAVAKAAIDARAKE